MPVIKYTTYIEAPISRCFDLARDVDVHTKTTSTTKEKAVAGVTKGLLQIGDSVTWEATHLGVRQRLTAKITKMNQPYTFTDELVKGAFHSFTHTHTFKERGTGTVMEDIFDYKSPLGIIGQLADVLFLKRYMKVFIVSRAKELKKIAERVE